MREQYAAFHNISDWELCEKIIMVRHPEYTKALNEANNSLTMFYRNCFLMSRANFLKYVEWLFDILFTFDEIRGFSSFDDVKRYVESHSERYKRNG